MSCINCKKRKYNMKEKIEKLSENDIKFCEIWSKIDKRSILTSDIDTCYKLVFKKGIDSHCPQCLRDYASYLNNYYNTIRDIYINSKKEEQIEDEKTSETPVKTTIKNTTTTTSKKEKTTTRPTTTRKRTTSSTTTKKTTNRRSKITYL